MQQLLYNKERTIGITSNDTFLFKIIPSNKRNREISIVWVVDEHLFNFFVTDYFQYELYKKKCDEFTLNDMSFTSDRFEILAYPVALVGYGNCIRVDIRRF